MKTFAAALFFAVAVLSVFSSALCICQGNPASSACKDCGSERGGGDVYKSFQGSLAALALECGVTEQDILEANGLSPGARIETGRQLRIPNALCSGDSSSGGADGGLAAACGEKSTVKRPPAPAGCRSFGGVRIDTAVSRNKFYYLTYFGCSGGRGDPGDNCIGACPMVSSILTTKGVKKLDTSSGRAYQESLAYFSANRNQYGCNARLKVTNPITGQAVVVKPTDAGPGCQVQTQGVKFDISWVAQKAIGYPHIVKVEKVADNTPIGPVSSCS